MRSLAIAAGLAIAVVLAAIQLASSAAFGDLAVRHSLPSLLHAAAPALLRGAVGGRLARAQAAVHNGDPDAEELVAQVPQSAAAVDLRGRLAERNGRLDAALAAYVQAGDLVRAQRLIDALEASDLPRAVAAEEQLLAKVSENPAASEDAGQAWWRLGQLQAALGYARPARRTAYWHEALASYRRALAYAPNEETYILAAAYQALANGDAASALSAYERAAQVVPNSADAYGGLAWSYAALGDCANARANAQRHDALLRTPASRPLTDDPNVGAPLRRCLAGGQ